MKKLFLLIFIFSITIYGDQIRVLHSGVTATKAERALKIKSNAINSHLINYLIVHYKKANAKNWKQIEMVPKDGLFIGVIPKNEVNLAKGIGLVYYIEVISIDGKSTKGFASVDEPQYVKILKADKKDNNLIETDDEDDEDAKLIKEEKDIFSDLSIFVEDDLNASKVTLASGKEESIFDAPFSVTVITRKTIENSGATLIPEIFRFVPGMIVREQTAGNYDVHIRGFDYIPPNAYLPTSSNSTTLLMINNRVVYNYINGGIAWETLPIGINDIERIEIVRGAASAMYGPNAASGVINIITRKIKKTNKKNIFSHIKVSYGDSTSFGEMNQGNSLFANGIIGFRDGKFNAVVSGNVTEKKRDFLKYWAWRNGELDENGNPKGGWVDDPADIKSVDNNDMTMDELYYTEIQYPEQNLGIKKYGVNLYVDYQLNKKVTINANLGGQYSDVQKAFLETLDSFLLGGYSKTQYIDLKGKVYDGEIQLSYQWGRQGYNNYPSFTNDLKILNFKSKYDFNIKGVNLRPALSYNRISYFGKGFGGEEEGLAVMENVGASLKFDYTLLETFRLFAAGRIDKYAHNDNFIPTFQFGSTVNIFKKVLLRAVYSRANRNPFMADTFFQVRNLNVNQPRVFLGNPDLEVVTMDMLEFGLRFKIMKKLSLDIELFRTTGKNYDDLAFTGELVVIDDVTRAKLTFTNMELKAIQTGVTFNLNYSYKKLLDLKLFGTIQKTDIKDFNENFLMNPNSTDLKDFEHKNTPRFYGGAYLNVKYKKFNITLNPYYYTSQTFIHTLGTIGIDQKFILNANLKYNLNKKFSIFLDGRNILNNRSREFGYADEIGGLYLLGAELDY